MAEHYTYLKWDNFEVLSPWLWEAHGQLLAGQFPHWNQHQMLGEPLHAKGQAGACYLPYTVCRLLCGATGLGPALYCNVIVYVHLPLASLGHYFLLRRLGAEAYWATLGTIGVITGGYLTTITTLWIFSFPLAALIPWACLAILGLLDADRLTPARTAVTAVLLAAIAAVGHPQMTVYYWLYAVLLAIGWACWVRRRPARLGRVAVAVLLAVFLACPVFLPMYELQLSSNRGDSYGLAEFTHRSVRPKELAGILLPVLAVDSEALPAEYTILAYQGFWAAPCLFALGGFLPAAAWRRLRKNRVVCGGESTENQPESQRLVRTVVLFLALAGIFLAFALGRHGFVYGLTRDIPVWSAFRWPFKFLALAMPSVAILAALSGQYVAARGTSRIAISAAIGALAAALVLLALWPSPIVCLPAGTVGLLTALVGTPIALLKTPWSRAAVLALSVVSSGATLALAHDSKAKVFSEPYASVGADVLGIDLNYRTIPLSPPAGPELRPAAYQEQGLLHSATMNGYDSATGIYAALYDRRMDDWLPAYVWGCPPPAFVPKLVASHFLRVMNVRYCIVAKDDVALLGLLDSQPGYGRVRELAHAVVFANDNAIPRAYFATRAEPYSPEALFRGLYENQVPMRTAFVEGLDRATDLGEAHVDSLAWDSASVRAMISAPQGGLLIVSVKSYPGWKAWIDGKETAIVNVNGLVQGVWVAPGSREVVLRFQPAVFGAGMRTALGALVVVVVWFACERRSRRRSGRARAEQVERAGGRSRSGA